MFAAPREMPLSGPAVGGVGGLRAEPGGGGAAVEQGAGELPVRGHYQHSHTAAALHNNGRESWKQPFDRQFSWETLLEGYECLCL